MEMMNGNKSPKSNPKQPPVDASVSTENDSSKSQSSVNSKTRSPHTGPLSNNEHKSIIKFSPPIPSSPFSNKHPTSTWTGIYLSVLIIFDCFFLATTISNTFFSESNIVDTITASYIQNPCCHLHGHSNLDCEIQTENIQLIESLFASSPPHSSRDPSYNLHTDDLTTHLPYYPLVTPKSVKEEIDYICMSSWITLLFLGVMALIFSWKSFPIYDRSDDSTASKYHLNYIHSRTFVPTIVLSKSLQLFNQYRSYQLIQIISTGFLIFYYLNFVSQTTFRVRMVLYCHSILDIKKMNDSSIYGYESWWISEEKNVFSTDLFTLYHFIFSRDDVRDELFHTLFSDIEIYMSVIWIFGHMVAVYLCKKASQNIYKLIEQIQHQNQVFIT